jgi:hypothetical protein
MSTRSVPVGPKVTEYLRNLTIDNTGVVERKISERVRKFVIPEVTKVFRTTNLPSGLDAIEKKYKERVEWPRSIYKYNILKEQCEAFSNIQDLLPWKLEYLDAYTHPWKPSDSYNLDLSLERNRRSLTKGAGLPTMGPKKEHLSDAKLYVEEKIKPNPILENCWSILPGVRTQQSHPDDPKVRLVWGTPISYWLLECMAVDSALNNTQSSISSDHDVFVFYTQPEEFGKWVRNRGDVVEWVNLDASQFDASVTASELEQVVKYFCPNFEFASLVTEYLQRADLLMPEGIISRTGGMPSGSKFTNLGNGLVNVLDIINSFRRYKLDKFISGIAVNGDDITVGLTTKLEGSNLEKISHESLRTLSTDKSVLGNFVWNSKWYIDSEIMTRPIWRVINSTMYSERQKSAIFGSKEYIELALASQLLDIEGHPFVILR